MFAFFLQLLFVLWVGVFHYGLSALGKVAVLFLLFSPMSLAFGEM